MRSWYWFQWKLKDECVSTKRDHRISTRDKFMFFWEALKMFDSQLLNRRYNFNIKKEATRDLPEQRKTKNTTAPWQLEIKGRLFWTTWEITINGVGIYDGWGRVRTNSSFPSTWLKRSWSKLNGIREFLWRIQLPLCIGPYPTASYQP